jgi:hypothetical protein
MNITQSRVHIATAAILIVALVAGFYWYSMRPQRLIGLCEEQSWDQLRELTKSTGAATGVIAAHDALYIRCMRDHGVDPK